MVDDRKLDVLRAIVEDYVATEEPVGSKALVERHGLGVSPATVRNDMAALEDEGYIHQPHTSAGRVPTDKGYRLFVDKLATLKPMSAAERRAIATLLDGAVDLDDVVQRSVRLLSQLTRQVAIVQYPTLSRSTVRHIELVSLTPTRLMVILILSTGRVEQRLVELDAPVVDGDLAELRVAVNQASGGVQIAEAAAALARPARRRTPRAGRLRPRDRGRAHRGDVRPPQRRAGRGRRHRQPRPLRRLRHRRPTSPRGAGGARRAAQAAGGVGHDALTVRIGHEGPYSALAATSVVATGYGPQEFHLGSLGVVGPTRMDYPGSMAAVRAVARYVSRILDEGNQ